jgi:hypothetical protein
MVTHLEAEVERTRIRLEELSRGLAAYRRMELAMTAPLAVGHGYFQSCLRSYRGRTNRVLAVAKALAVLDRPASMREIRKIVVLEAGSREDRPEGGGGEFAHVVNQHTRTVKRPLFRLVRQAPIDGIQKQGVYVLTPWGRRVCGITNKP